MFTALLTSKRFAPIFVCQFFSALNDNFIKNALAFLIVFRIGAEGSDMLVTLAGATLIIPFVFLSALGGELADRYDKAAVARWIKLAEIPIAIMAAVGFVLSSIPLLFAALLGFGIMAALFGPIKYGILPDHLETRELSSANALVEGATFLAVLTGTIAGGLTMSASFGVPDWAVALTIIAFAGFGLISARMIPATGEAVPDLTIRRNPLASTLGLLGELRRDQRLWRGGLITSWFWFVGVVTLALLPTLVKSAIGGTEEVATALLVVFVVGIAFGSWAAARGSHNRPNLALVPIGAFGMAAAATYAGFTLNGVVAAPGATMTLSAFLASATGQHTVAAFFMLAAAGGLFIVPAFAAVQAWADPTRRARTVAAVNILNGIFMTVASLILLGLQIAATPLPVLFWLLGAATLAVAVYVVRVWGRDGVRDLGLAIFKAFLGLEVKGTENLPKPGTPAIIAPNHVSLLDGPLMHAILPDHAAFAVDSGMAKAWWVRPFLKVINAYTLDPTEPMATRHLVNEVKSGQTLVIFPEGRLTVTGGLMKVYDGTAMIADRADAAIVPVRITGPERSPWSYLRKTQTKKRWFPKTTIEILPARKLSVPDALAGKARRRAAGARLQDIMVETAVETANLDRTIFEALADAARTRDTGRPAVADPTGVKLSYRKLLAGAQALGAKLAPLAEDGEAVGVLLPNTVGGAVTFFALQTVGRVPAMLNFTAGANNVKAACKTAAIRTVLTSRLFVDRGHLHDLIAALEGQVRIVYLEDIRASVTTGDKLKAAARGGRPQFARGADDPAVILFTSGSEGSPKAVVLSHRNVLANAIQALTLVAADGEDMVFNVLPLFHSFGLTAGLVMPLVGGVPVYLYPSPLHYRIVPELVYQTNATILFGTDTFLAGYARTAHPYDFSQLRLVLAGAEPVKDTTRKTYMETFGVRILEGYGVTETAPVLAINTPLANRSGTVGRLVPLVEARLEAVPGIEEGGRLFVRGPNVMLGYYTADNPGVLMPPEDGWHDTGDIVTIDSDGFVKIRGRAKRFAKIGGEMVSLAAVEALVADAFGGVPSIAVNLPDAKKGERLVLVTEAEGLTRSDLSDAMKARGAADIMVPGDILYVDRIPLLGSGKPDFPAAARLAIARVAGTVQDAAE
jgi:acyl-[acyl-carrier-protein]-phospholipid O-acyltransferase/long-chain-fatty-acid--[acyl-carrier-protein] ligase